MENMRELLRSLPKIDELLMDERLVFFMESTPRAVVVDAAREEIDTIRKEIRSGERTEVPERSWILDQICARAGIQKKRSFRSVINGTGIVLHTNLGRASLSKRAVDHVASTSAAYSNLEYDLKTGQRGSRYSHVEQLITKITGAEAAMVVNNNAAATMLCLSALAYGKDVVTSRGELVEIGGSFRMPDIMELSGAYLKEVGTTNRTTVNDYRKVYDPEKTGVFLKVHTSNYKIVGFTHEASLKELAALGTEYHVPVVYDLGSGLMVDLSRYGVEEPTVPDAVKGGADVVLFSGDKLLGGPQAGILIGRKALIDKMKSHPLARVTRIDKMTLAALEATFYEYLDFNEAKKKIPVLDRITRSKEELHLLTERLRSEILRETDHFRLEVGPCNDQIGGGSAPTVNLKGYAVYITSEIISAERLERLLRKGAVPVISRISHDQVILSVRAMDASEFADVARALRLAADTIR